MLNRRDFIKALAATAGAAEFAARAGAAESARAKSVNAVLGPVPAAQLGTTLMHEHILVDFVGADKIAPGRYDADEVVRVALPHLEKIKSLGCRTFLDCTPAYLGRDPALLARLARASGLQIVTNTGFYGAVGNKYLPRFAFGETAKQLAARWEREFRSGIPPGGIRPGFIKIGVDSGPLSEMHAKLVSAAALTHLATGLAIMAHTGDGVAALAELAVLKRHGAPASAFIWAHAQNEKDTSVHRRAAEAGAWVEFDGISEEGLARHVKLVLEMKKHRLLDRVLVSQDAGWYHVGEPHGGNFRGYDFLFQGFVPEARKAGLNESEVRQLLVENPRRALAF
jgi:predicted metal-dependent phosphotriesterase family hydrolase